MSKLALRRESRIGSRDMALEWLGVELECMMGSKSAFESISSSGISVSGALLHLRRSGAGDKRKGETFVSTDYRKEHSNKPI
jgi:hypothetical protein